VGDRFTPLNLSTNKTAPHLQIHPNPVLSRKNALHALKEADFSTSMYDTGFGAQETGSGGK